jgi:cation:H+ antiporter
LAVAGIAFFIGAAVSLATSWILVSRLERVGERLGLSEALLGIVAALAADTPEITASISALFQHQRAIGAGVVIGSNVFNLAALLGLSAVISGYLALHRRVILLGGAVGVSIALCAFSTSIGIISVESGLACSSVVFVSYVVLLGVRRTSLDRLPIPRRLTSWLRSAIDEEEQELEVAIRPPRGRPLDAFTAIGALTVVIIASIAMERGASSFGRHFHVADAIIGAVVLAAVTSLPNAVAAIHLAAKGRGAAAFSTALNSNNINVVAGLLVPAIILGLAPSSNAGSITVGWYVGLTVLVLALAYVGRGLGRSAGWVVVAAYAMFVGIVITVS